MTTIVNLYGWPEGTHKTCNDCQRDLPMGHFKIGGYTADRMFSLHESTCLQCKREMYEARKVLPIGRFRGVDIDRIHRRRGAMKKNKAAA